MALHAYTFGKKRQKHPGTGSEIQNTFARKYTNYIQKPVDSSRDGKSLVASQVSAMPSKNDDDEYDSISYTSFVI